MKALWVILGFVLLVVGFCSMILDIMGLQFTFMRWLSDIDGVLKTIIYLVMCFGGVALMYLNGTNWRYDPDAPADL